MMYWHMQYTMWKFGRVWQREAGQELTTTMLLFNVLFGSDTLFPTPTSPPSSGARHGISQVGDNSQRLCRESERWHLNLADGVGVNILCNCIRLTHHCCHLAVCYVCHASNTNHRNAQVVLWLHHLGVFVQSITAVFLSLQSSHHLVAWISGLPHSLAPMGSLYKNHSLCMCHELSVTSVTCPFLFHTPLLQHTIWTVYVISRGSVLSWYKHQQSHCLTLPLLVCEALL